MIGILAGESASHANPSQLTVMRVPRSCDCSVALAMLKFVCEAIRNQRAKHFETKSKQQEPSLDFEQCWSKYLKKRKPRMVQQNKQLKLADNMATFC